MSRNSRGGRLAAVAASATVLAAAVSACGDDGDDTGATSGDTTAAASTSDVTVTATEYEFGLSATPTADTETVTFKDDGEQPHVLVFAKINEGYTVDEAVAAEGKKGTAEEIGVVDAKPGQSSTIEVKGPLEPGNYALLCPLPGPEGKFHYELGQLEEFEIE